MQNKLTIHHLAKRLPYGLKCRVTDEGKTTIETMNSVYSDGSATFFDLIESSQGVTNIKPIFFPISVLTQDITVGGKTFVPIERMKEWYNGLPDCFIQSLHYINKDGAFTFFGLEEDMPYEVSMPYQMYEFLHQWHIDYESLISSGLAISVFDLPENPYK